MENARNRILSLGDAVFLPSVQSHFYELSQASQIAAELKVTLSFLEGLLKIDNQKRDTQLLLDLEQDFYDLTVPKPQPEDMFTSDVTPAHLSGKAWDRPRRSPTSPASPTAADSSPASRACTDRTK